MPQGLSTTTDVRRLLALLAANDPAARNALIERALARLTALARRQLSQFPAVARWEQTEDVVQGAAQRLDRALRAVHPAEPRELFRLCSALIRRELIDLKRRHHGPQGIGAHHASPIPDTSGSRPRAPAERASDSTYDPGKLACWTELHDRIDSLPDELREIFDLLWYQELTHAEAAQLLGVSTKTISRRGAARLAVHDLINGGDPP